MHAYEVEKHAFIGPTCARCPSTFVSASPTIRFT
jgi:hypothetical protein